MDKHIQAQLITIGRNIRCTRASRDMKQDELAKMAGITKSALSKIENGLSLHVSHYRLYIIAFALGKNFADLLGR